MRGATEHFGITVSLPTSCSLLVWNGLMWQSPDHEIGLYSAVIIMLSWLSHHVWWKSSFVPRPCSLGTRLHGLGTRLDGSHVTVTWLSIWIGIYKVTATAYMSPLCTRTYTPPPVAMRACASLSRRDWVPLGAKSSTSNTTTWLTWRGSLRSKGNKTWR